MGYTSVAGTQEVRIYNTEEHKELLDKIITRYVGLFSPVKQSDPKELTNRIYMEFKQAVEYNRALADQEAKESIVEGLESLLEVL